MFYAQPLQLLKSSCSQVLAASWRSCSTFISMVMQTPHLLVLGQRPRRDLYLLCCRLAIGLSRPVGEDVMIRQMLEAAGDAVILLDTVVDAIRGPQDERAAPSPRRSRSGSAPRPKSASPSVPPGNFTPPGNFQAPRPAFFRGPQVFVPPQGYQPPRAPMPPGHPWPHPPRQQFRPRPEPVPQAPPAPPAPRPMQTPAPGPARDTRPCQKLRHSRKLLMSFWIIC